MCDALVFFILENKILGQPLQSPQRAAGPARSDLKAISPFALPGVKKRRLFEDKPARSSCALDRQGKRAADGPGPIPNMVCPWQLYEKFLLSCPQCFQRRNAS